MNTEYPAGVYRLLRGTKTRIEEGQVRTYGPGDHIELSAREANILRLSIEPIPASPSPEPHPTFSELGAYEAMGYVMAAPKEGDLDELQALEESGKARKSVFRAIEERREALKSS